MTCHPTGWQPCCSSKTANCWTPPSPRATRPWNGTVSRWRCSACSSRAERDAGGSPGGSTLATQIEKYRHSPNGRTASIRDKLQQMASASLRAYRLGEDTTEARRKLVVTYLNTMPLSAKSGFGEVHGIGDGLWAWYGRDFAEVQRTLRSAKSPLRMPGPWHCSTSRC